MKKRTSECIIGKFIYIESYLSASIPVYTEHYMTTYRKITNWVLRRLILQGVVKTEKCTEIHCQNGPAVATQTFF